MNRTTDLLRGLSPVLLLFAALTGTLTRQSLWWDEGISMHLASLSWAGIVSDRAANIHPPLYFFALKAWLALAGHSPFAARYLSVLGAVLLPPLTYVFLRRRAGARAGRAAAWLVALAPPFFVYGQEARAYAWLPLLWLLLLAQVWPESAPRALRSPVAAFRLGLTQAVLALWHYAGIVAVAWANVPLMLSLLRRRDARLWRRWLAATAITLAPAALWGIAVLHAGAAGLHEAGMGNALAEPVPASYLWRLIAVFHATGLPAALADALLCRPAILLGGLLLPVIALSLRERLPRHLLLAWLLPLTVAVPIWHLSPQAHPRYLLPFVLGGWLIVGIGVSDASVPRVLRRLLLAAALTVSVVSLWAYLTIPRYARSDVRAVAAYLRQHARPGEVVLVPHTDWSLPQYDLGAAMWRMLPAPQDEQAVAETLSHLPPADRLYLLDYRRGALDPRGEVRSLLAWRGAPAATVDFQGVFLQRYDLIAPPVIPACRPLPPTEVGQSQVRLVGAVWDAHPQSGAAVPLQLCWQGAASPERLAVALRLYAPGGALVASRDDVLLDAQGRPAELWSAAPATTFHLLPLPVGLLPRPFRLELSVYRTADPAHPLPLRGAGQAARVSVPLGVLTPTLSPWLDVSPYGLPDGPTTPRLTLSPGVTLAGAALDRPEAAPGQTVYLTLRGRAVAAGAAPSLTVRLRQPGATLAQAAALVPTLPAGRPWREVLPLPVPPDADAGPATVTLRTSAGEWPVAHLSLRGAAHTFTLPPLAIPLHARADDVVELAGCDAPDGTVRVGRPLTVTLVWRAGAAAAARQWTVFTHLLGADGTILAQHDGMPQGGQRPTGGWLAGEVIVDRHVLSWQRSYSGTAVLRVGLYDAATGERVRWDEGTDAVTLPLTLTVAP